MVSTHLNLNVHTVTHTLVHHTHTHQHTSPHFTLTDWAAHTAQHSTPPSPSQCAPAAASLLHALRAHMDAGVGGGGRAPSDFAPHQQLAWVLEEMVAQTDDVHNSSAVVQQQGKAGQSAVLQAGSKNSSAPMSAHQWAHLHTVVLPALLHELRLPWHAALWACAQASTAAGSGRAEGDVVSAAGPALLLHTAARSLVAAHIAADTRTGSVQARHARLGQLCLAIRHFLQLIPPSPSQLSSPVTRNLSAVSVQLQAAPSPWITLASLSTQTLLAHASSLSGCGSTAVTDLSRALQTLCTQTTAMASTHSSSASVSSSAQLSALTAAVQEISAILERSNHTLLHSLMQPLLLPALQALVTGAGLQQQQQGQQDGGVRLVAQGRCWALLGEARLQLLVPPPGVCF